MRFVIHAYTKFKHRVFGNEIVIGKYGERLQSINHIRLKLKYIKITIHAAIYLFRQHTTTCYGIVYYQLNTCDLFIRRNYPRIK